MYLDDIPAMLTRLQLCLFAPPPSEMHGGQDSRQVHTAGTRTIFPHGAISQALMSISLQASG